VLTGTIIPNLAEASGPDWRIRRQQYLEAIAFYEKFSKVYFLENSRYDLASDAAFANSESCCMQKFLVSTNPERGKGYQEFEMLDTFVRDTLTEERFLKVTGRYIYVNFARHFSFLVAQGSHYDLVIDRLAGMRLALTSLFCIDRQIYLRHVQNCYREMDDRKGVWAEHVMYGLVKRLQAVTFFPATPILQSAGGPHPQEAFKVAAKNLQRSLFSAVKVRQLLR
jgi:hypothetical protein